MARTHPELMLDADSNLLSLYKKDPETGQPSSELLTAHQVASCVKFVRLTASTDIDELPTVLHETLDPETCRGMKTNLIGGPTGAGKTSLTHIMAGGMETPPKIAADTKCPKVYIFKLKNDDEEEVKDCDDYAILDTAGLCDTAAEANADVGVQELLINAVAATIQLHELQIVSFLMCVDSAGRLPGNFGEVWPEMQVALGGDRIMPLSKFVVTKVNGDSDVNRKKLKKIKEQRFFKDLKESPFGWEVVTAGRENLAELATVLKPVTSSAWGLTGQHVNAESESIQTIAARAAHLWEMIQRDSASVDMTADEQAAELQEAIQQLKVDLANARCYNWQLKKDIGARIDAKSEELQQIQKDKSISEAEKARQLQVWMKEVEAMEQEIRKMHGFGAFFRHLVGGFGGGDDDRARVHRQRPALPAAPINLCPTALSSVR